MNARLFSFIFLFFVSLISSCDESNPINENNPIEVVPLRVGNSWVNTYSKYDSNGTVTSTGVESVWVSGDTLISGTRYSIVSSQEKESNGIICPISIYFAKSSTAGYTEKYTTGGDFTYDYPPRAGDSTILGTNELVKVAAGTYNCVVYKFPAGISRTDSGDVLLYGRTYIYPSIGIIKKELEVPPNNNLFYMYTLDHMSLHFN